MNKDKEVVFVFESDPFVRTVLCATGKFVPDDDQAYNCFILLTIKQEAVYYGYRYYPGNSNDESYYWNCLKENSSV